MTAVAPYSTRARPGATVWLSDPTWPNHNPIAENSGLKTATYPYFDPATRGVKFDAMLAGSPELLRLVRSPVFSADTQVKALAAVLDKAGIGGTTAKFLKVLTANRRLFAVTDVIRAYRALVARFKGEAAAEVTVAEALNEKNLNALKTALKSVTGKDITLSVKVDPTIIGGLVVKLGSRMVDSSLRTKLNSIKHAMKEAG